MAPSGAAATARRAGAEAPTQASRCREQPTDAFEHVSPPRRQSADRVEKRHSRFSSTLSGNVVARPRVPPAGVVGTSQIFAGRRSRGTGQAFRRRLRRPQASHLAASPHREHAARSFTPVVTPFADGAVDGDAFERLVDPQAASGSHSVVVMGDHRRAHQPQPCRARRALPARRRHCGRAPARRRRHRHAERRRHAGAHARRRAGRRRRRARPRSRVREALSGRSRALLHERRPQHRAARADLKHSRARGGGSRSGDRRAHRRRFREPPRLQAALHPASIS